MIMPLGRVQILLVIPPANFSIFAQFSSTVDQESTNDLTMFNKWGLASSKGMTTLDSRWVMTVVWKLCYYRERVHRAPSLAGLTQLTLQHSYTTGQSLPRRVPSWYSSLANKRMSTMQHPPTYTYFSTQSLSPIYYTFITNYQMSTWCPVIIYIIIIFNRNDFHFCEHIKQMKENKNKL